MARHWLLIFRSQNILSESITHSTDHLCWSQQIGVSSQYMVNSRQKMPCLLKTGCFLVIHHCKWISKYVIFKATMQQSVTSTCYSTWEHTLQFMAHIKQYKWNPSRLNLSIAYVKMFCNRTTSTNFTYCFHKVMPINVERSVLTYVRYFPLFHFTKWPTI